MKRQKEKIGRKILSFVLTVALIVSNMTGIVPGTSLKALAVDDITISSVEDWNSFAASVKGGETYSGKTVTLTADVGPVTTMADGSFSGTFDGGGHTLTVNISGGAVATFKIIKGGTIKNLNLAGSVTGSEFHSAALAVKVDGSCTIDKVNVAVTVNSSTNYAGGFIGHGMTGNTISITNSEFSGSINGTGSQALYFGGFLGWSGKSTATIENCAFAGTYSNVKSFNAVGFSCGAMQKVSVSDFYSNAADIYGYTGNSGLRMYNPTGGQQAVAARVDSNDTRTYYNTFSSALENWTDGSTLALLADATTSGGITLSESGASKTLDLNGQTLIPGDSVIVAAGSLTLLGTNGGELKRGVQVINVSEGATFNLEGGTVSGTSTTVDQSTVNGRGTFNLNGGTVQSAGSNALSLYGKATLNLNGSMVCATSDSTDMTRSSAILTKAESDITINVSGGTISTNTGCGIYTRGTGTTVNISGGVFTSTTGNYAVSGNNQKTINLSGNPKMEGKGIYLFSGKKITINGELTNTTPIGVTMQTVGVFTDSAEVAFNDAGKFTSDNDAYMVGKNADGQLLLGTPCTLSYNANGAASGTLPADAKSYASDSIVTVLGNTGNLVNTGYVFDGWNTAADGTGASYEADDTFTISADTTLYAKWVVASVTTGDETKKYGLLADAVAAWNSAADGSTLTLLVDVTTDSTVTISGTKILDLNGFGIKRTGSGRVFVVPSGAALTLKDSGTNTHKYTIDSSIPNGAGLAKVNDGATGDGVKTFTGGYITGGIVNDDGAGFHVSGTLNMTGGTIIGNQSTAGNKTGGGVFVTNGGSFNMTGGALICNTAQYGGGIGSAMPGSGFTTLNLCGGSIVNNLSRGTGGGVHMNANGGSSTRGIKVIVADNMVIENNHTNGVWSNNANAGGGMVLDGAGTVFQLSGTPTIRGNTAGEGTSEHPFVDNNIFFTDRGTPKVTVGDLNPTVPIGVTMMSDTGGVFTSSTNTDNNDVSKFTSDLDAYAIGKNADGQLYLGIAVTATFETEHGTAPASQMVVSGGKITMPDAPEASGYTFGGWYDGSTTYEAGDEATLDASKTFTAQWTEVTNLTIKQGDYIRMGAYNGYDVDWFCAKVNATGVMMMSKYVIKNSRFGANATYKTSDIHAWLDLNSGGWFATDLGLTKKELSLVRTVNLSGTNGDGTDSFIIPAYGNNEMNKGTGYTHAGYINDPATIASVFWLRTPRDSSNARVVRSIDNTVVARYSGAVYGGRGVRPMFYLDTNAIKNMPYTGSGTADDPYSFVPQTGKGTQADPYVFYPRHYLYTDVSAGGSISTSASRDDIVIYKAEYKGVQTNKLVEEAEVTLTVKTDTGYVFDDILIRLNTPTATNVSPKLTALSGTNGNNNENYPNLVDGSNNKWCLPFNGNAYIIIKAPSLIGMTGYTLKTANDTQAQYGRNWKDWTIYGANFASDSEATIDSDKWKVVTSVTGDTKLRAENFANSDYALESEAEPYQYYKILITANNKGGNGDNLIQMSEFTITGNTYEKLDVTQDGDSYTFMMPKKYDVNDVKVKATFLGTVYFLKKDVNEQWTAVANAEKSWFAGSTYNVTDEIANKYSADKYVFKGYGTEYSDAGEYTAASAGQEISLGTGKSPLYLYYELERHGLVFYQDVIGATVYKTVSLPYGAKLSAYADEVPETQDYYTFAGWSTDKDQTSFEGATNLVDWTTLTMNGEVIEVYPIWVHDRVEVKLTSGYDDSQNAAPFFVELGGTIATQNMTRDGYELEGWYTQNGTKWDAAWTVTPEYCDVDAEGNNIVQTDNEKKYNYYTLTLTAHWTPLNREVVYALGEHAKDGASAPENGSVTMGSTTILAAGPDVAEGWLFLGWQDG